MINQFWTDATTGITAALSGLCDDVEQHPGQFTEDELQRVARARRAVRVALADIQATNLTNLRRQEYTLQMAAMIICSDRNGPDRDSSAVEIAEKLCGVLPRNRWNSEDYAPVDPSTISAQNLWSGEVGKKGIALWAVTWRQTIKVTT